jgi:uncharacterized protein (TIGR02246 family)
MILLATALYAGSGLGGVPVSATQEERIARGSFDVQITQVDEEAFAGGHQLGRYNLTKQYHGGLDATAEGEMLTALTAVEGSGGYVAIERVVGNLDGRSGSFVLQHSGAMSGGTQTMTIEVVPDSGTGELDGLAGTLGVEILDDGQHLYEFRYSFPGRGTSPSASDEADIHGFWSTLDETWASRDADRFSRLFTEDASFAFVDRGESLEGRVAIHQRFTEQFLAQRPELRHRTTVLQIRPMARHVAAVDGEVRILEESAGGGAPTVLRQFAITALMVQEGETWQVHLLRAYQLQQQPVQTRPSPTSLHVGHQSFWRSFAARSQPARSAAAT